MPKRLVVVDEQLGQSHCKSWCGTRDANMVDTSRKPKPARWRALVSRNRFRNRRCAVNSKRVFIATSCGKVANSGRQNDRTTFNTTNPITLRTLTRATCASRLADACCQKIYSGLGRKDSPVAYQIH